MIRTFTIENKKNLRHRSTKRSETRGDLRYPGGASPTWLAVLCVKTLLTADMYMYNI